MRYNIFFICCITLMMSACSPVTKLHSTQAILLQQEKKDSSETERYSIAKNKDASFNNYPYSSNPVFISTDSKFSIKIEGVYPGLLYSKEETKNLFKRDSAPISERQFNHLRGKQLWLLVTISSLNTKDPLETNSKRYFKATNVKLESQPFSLLPLDSEEKYIFTHESDSSYRIVFQLYEVEGLAIKRELAKIGRNPGVFGAAEAVYHTIKNTAGALIGDILESRLNEATTENLALERFLLALGATEEFHGEILVLRNNSFSNTSPKFSLTSGSNIKEIKQFTNFIIAKQDEYYQSIGKENNVDLDQDELESLLTEDIKTPFVDNSYVAVDYFKRDKSAHSYDHYQDKMENLNNRTFTINEDCTDDDATIETDTECLRQHAFIKFSIQESFSPKTALIKENLGLSIPRNHEKVYNTLKTLHDSLTPMHDILNSISNIDKKIDELRIQREKIRDKIIASQELSDSLEEAIDNSDMDDFKNKIEIENDFFTENINSITEKINKLNSEKQSKEEMLKKDSHNYETLKTIMRNIESQGLDIKEWERHILRQPD